MKKNVAVIFLFLFLSLGAQNSFVGCGAQSECQANQTQDCSCTDNAKGTQTCTTGGSWSTCQCAGADGSTAEATQEQPNEAAQEPSNETSPEQPNEVSPELPNEASQGNDAGTTEQTQATEKSTVESAPEATQDRSSNSCPATCSKDAECQVSACGKRQSCHSNLSKCVDPTVVCPASCKQDIDCSDKPGCQARTFCYRSRPDKTEGTCTVPASGNECPTQCSSSLDCLKAACGAKRYCNDNGQCVEKASELCPSTCQSDADCSSSGCGIKTSCKSGTCETSCPSSCKKDTDCQSCNGICYLQSPTASSGLCRPPHPSNVCPATCSSTYECHTTACGTKRFCNLTTTKTCVAAATTCPKQCKVDSDCKTLSSCSSNACYAGYCLPLPTSSCPAKCTKNFDCFVAGCQDKRTCSSSTKTCVK